MRLPPSTRLCRTPRVLHTCCQTTSSHVSVVPARSLALFCPALLIHCESHQKHFLFVIGQNTSCSPSYLGTAQLDDFSFVSKCTALQYSVPY